MFEILNSNYQRTSLMRYFIRYRCKQQIAALLDFDVKLLTHSRFRGVDWLNMTKETTNKKDLELFKKILHLRTKKATNGKLIDQEWYENVLFATGPCNKWYTVQREFNHQALEFFYAVFKLLPKTMKLKNYMWERIIQELIAAGPVPKVITDFIDNLIKDRQVHFYHSTWMRILDTSDLYAPDLAKVLRDNHVPKEFLDSTYSTIGAVAYQIADGSLKSLDEILDSESYQKLLPISKKHCWFKFAEFFVYNERFDVYQKIMEHCVENNLIDCYAEYKWTDLAIVNIAQFPKVFAAKPDTIILEAHNYYKLLKASLKQSASVAAFSRIMDYVPDSIKSHLSDLWGLEHAIAHSITLFENIIQYIISKKPLSCTDCGEELAMSALENGGINRLLQLAKLSIKYDFFEAIRISPLTLLEAYKDSHEIIRIIMDESNLPKKIANEILSYADPEYQDHKLFKNILTKHSVTISCLEPDNIEPRMLNLMLQHCDLAYGYTNIASITLANKNNRQAAAKALCANKHISAWDLSSILKNELTRPTTIGNAISTMALGIIDKDADVNRTATCNILSNVTHVVKYYCIADKYAEYIKYVVLNNNCDITKQTITSNFVNELARYNYGDDRMLMIYTDQMLKLKQHITNTKERSEKMSEVLKQRSIYFLVNNYMPKTLSALLEPNFLEIPQDLLPLFQQYAMPAYTLNFKLHTLDQRLIQGNDKLCYCC